MKRLLFVLGTCAFLSFPVFGIPDLEFNPETLGWFYDGGGTFQFSQSVAIRRVQGGTGDPLVGKLVDIPPLTVSGLPTCPYTLRATAPVEIKDGRGGVLLTGRLGEGQLIPIGATAAAYPYIKVDISNYTINNTIGSALLTYWESALVIGIDFNLSMENNITMSSMLAGGVADADGFSGSMTAVIPEPATVALLGLGGAVLAATRKRG
jgi:hypothetical protein